MKRGKWRPAGDVAENAALFLPVRLEKLFAAGRKSLATIPSADALHKLRLKTKRVRYGIELFRNCYGPGLDSILNALRDLQGYLGEVNDYATARRLIQGGPGTDPAALRVVEQGLARRQREHAAKLLRYWKESFDLPDQERRWRLYLVRPRGRRG